MATTDDYRRALNAALDDERYQWHTPLGDLLQDDIHSARNSNDPAIMAASIKRLAQYRKAVDHPDNGFVALASRLIVST